MKTKIIVTGAVLGALVAAVPAMAHTTDATVSCTEASFNYSQFPNAPQTANWLVTSDGATVGSGTFAWNGGASTIENADYALPAGTHTIQAYTWWTASDGNTRDQDSPAVATAVMTCGTVTPPPDVVTPPADNPPPVDDVAPVTFSAPAVALASAPAPAVAKAKVVTKHHKIVHKPKVKKKPHVAAAKVAKVVRKAPKLTG